MSVPVISTTAFAGIPDFIETVAGYKALDAVFEQSNIPLELVCQKGRFVPQRDFVKVLEQAARVTGDRNLGLNVASHMSIASWGTFGEYILQSPDVSTALERTKHSIQYHGSMLLFDFSVRGDELAVLYKNPTVGMVGYTHFAVCAAKIINTITETFCMKGEVPLRVELDINKPHNWSTYEELFHCPVVFNRPHIAIVYSVDLVDSRSNRLDISQTITMADLRRALLNEAPLDLSGIVREMIRIRLYSGSVDIEHVASHLGIGVRNLQRQLAAENLTFRDLVLQVRAKRAMELLNETDSSVTDIAMTLGYSSAAHFTRAFKQTVGFTPSQIRSC